MASTLEVVYSWVEVKVQGVDYSWAEVKVQGVVYSWAEVKVQGVVYVLDKQVYNSKLLVGFN